ncbi:MAG TPA: hypothetical protein DCS93_22935 [Microscillaceae bacterium]|nr:hypothetical protein [Microscillaceae bacterium]
MKKYFVCIFLQAILWGCMMTGVSFAQTSKQSDSLKVVQLNRQLKTAIVQKQYTQAVNFGKQSLLLTKRHLLVQNQVETLLLLGELYTQTDKTTEALTHYLQAENLAQLYNMRLQLVKLYDDLGLFLRRHRLYKKALQNFQTAYQLRQKNKYAENVINIEQMAFCYFMLKDYAQSQKFYEKLLAIYQKAGNQRQITQTLEQLAKVSSVGKSYASATQYNLALLKLYQKSGAWHQVTAVYNNLGFLYKRRGALTTAMDYFRRSSELVKQQNIQIPKAAQATLWVNTGVAHINQQAFNRASKSFRQAAQVASKNSLKRAEIHNFAGSNYYISGNNFQAKREVKQAIAIAAPKRAWRVLLTSYELLRRIYVQEEDQKRAQEYQKKYEELSRQLREDQKKAEQQTSYNQVLMDEQESRIKNLLAEQRQLQELKDQQERQQKNLLIKNNLIKIQQQQLNLLKKENELNEVSIQKAALDKIRQQQALEISQGKLREANLARDKTLATLALERKNNEQKIQEAQNRRKLEKLEAEKRIQQQEIRQQRQGVFFAIVLVIVLLLFYLRQRKNNQILGKINRQLQNLDRFKQQMLGMIVHDLKNPLNSIIGLSDARLESAYTSINHAGRRMQTLVMNILDVQKMEEAQMTLSQEKVQVVPLLQDACYRVRFPMQDKKIQVHLEVQSNATLAIDIELITRVLVNLLTNAIKYTPQNGAIWLKAEATESKFYKMSVADNGVGIAPESLDKVFDRFQQVDSPQQNFKGSSGLGLTFCKLAVEMHQGQIGVASVLGEGATFWFTIPLAEVQETANVEQSPLELQYATTSEFDFSAQDTQLLTTLVAQLKQYPFYETSDILDVLNTINDHSSNALQRWKIEVEDSLYAYNEARYQALMEVV